MNDRALILRALRETLRLDGTLDTLAITRHLMDTGVLLWDEESYGETRVDAAVTSAPLDASESDLVEEIARSLGYPEVIA